MVEFFFDSYAVIEILKGNPNYARYSEEEITITIFNLVEIYWSTLQDSDEKTADQVYRRFRDCVVELPDDIIKAAVKFRKTNKQKDLSYADCIGYIYSMKKSLVFLTGDKQFEDLQNVEFIK